MTRRSMRISLMLPAIRRHAAQKKLASIKALLICCGCNGVAVMPWVCLDGHIICENCARTQDQPPTRPGKCPRCDRPSGFCKFMSRVARVDTMDEVEETLRCVICYKINPVGYTCVFGHLTCSRCRPRLLADLCPYCREPGLTECQLYHRVAVIALEDCRVECRNCNFGCIEAYSVSTLQAHEDDCSYAETFCFAWHMGPCQWVGSMRQLSVHLRAKACVQVRKGTKIRGGEEKIVI